MLQYSKKRTGARPSEGRVVSFENAFEARAVRALNAIARATTRAATVGRAAYTAARPGVCIQVMAAPCPTFPSPCLD